MNAASLIRSVARYTADFREARRRSRVERMILEMPVHLRKDIGWPDAYPRRVRH